LLKLAKSRKQLAGFISYRPHSQVGSQPGNNAVHTLSQWSLFNRARRSSSGKSSRRLCRTRRDFAGAGSDPGSEWDSDSGGQHNCGEVFFAEDFHSLPSLPPGRRSSLIVGNTEEVLDHLRQIARGARTGRGHQRSPGVHLEQFMPDEIAPVCAPRIQRMFSWALPSGELGGLPGEFYQFANSIRSDLSTVSVRPLKEAA
jgi:hypothetical protein